MIQLGSPVGKDSHGRRKIRCLRMRSIFRPERIVPVCPANRREELDAACDPRTAVILTTDRAYHSVPWYETRQIFHPLTNHQAIASRRTAKGAPRSLLH